MVQQVLPKTYSSITHTHTYTHSPIKAIPALKHT